MQALCTLLPPEFSRQVVEARRLLSRERSIGRIYEPPFAHLTLQLAEDYDWDGLAGALAELAAKEEPFQCETVGLWLSHGDASADVAVIPYVSERLRAFHRRVCEAASPFAKGRVREFDNPDSWFPHVTIKRCGANEPAFGRGMRELRRLRFRGWRFAVDNIAVQHDPAMDSSSHYLRLHFPFGGKPTDVAQPLETNAVVTAVRPPGPRARLAKWVFDVRLDSGEAVEAAVMGDELVTLMYDCRCSVAHFEGARCRVEDGVVAGVQPKTPFPIAS